MYLNPQQNLDVKPKFAITMMSILRKISPVYILPLVMAFVISCKGPTGEEKQDEAKLKKEEVEKTVREVVYPLPSTYEITEMLNEIEASYILGLTNDIANAEKYFTDKKQALNLGVYSADLSYASTYNMKQQTLDFMDVSQDLVKELRITGAFSSGFVEEVETNIDNKEELVDLITNSFYDTYEYLVKNNKEDLSLLVITGSWVEALYITTHISETTYENPRIVEIIMEQKDSLAKLLELLKPHNEHETIQDLLIELKPIMEVYQEVGDSSITQKQLKEIVSRIANIRADIIS